MTELSVGWDDADIRDHVEEYWDQETWEIYVGASYCLGVTHTITVLGGIFMLIGAWRWWRRR